MKWSLDEPDIFDRNCVNWSLKYLSSPNANILIEIIVSSLIQFQISRESFLVVMEALKALKHINDRYKLTVFGYIHHMQSKLKLNGVATLINCMILGFYIFLNVLQGLELNVLKQLLID